MHRYTWTCVACNSWNPTYREACSRCACPVNPSAAALERHKTAFATGQKAAPGNNETHIPIEEMCPQCGHSYNQFMPSCQNCRSKFWCRWEKFWYDHPLTLASLGQNRGARAIGSAFIVAIATFFLYAVLVYWLGQSSKSDWERLLVLDVVLLYGGYEVWAFTHGRRTSIDRFTHNATPDKTSIRTFGLVLDVVVTLGATYLVLIWSQA